MKTANELNCQLNLAEIEIDRLKEENERLIKKYDSDTNRLNRDCQKLESDLVKAKEALNKIKKLSKYDSLYNFQTIGKIANEYFESSPTVKPEQTEEPSSPLKDLIQSVKNLSDYVDENQLKVVEVEQPTESQEELWKEVDTLIGFSSGPPTMLAKNHFTITRK